MLQQTQVATVIPYFLRFVEKFASIRELAAAPVDDVLAAWSGLGYYSRARNLHRAAKISMEKFDGDLPHDFDRLSDLPGIGRSTAGAILAQAFGLRFPILDGNVKRVLARFHGIRGWPGSTSVQQKLWTLADVHTPQQRVVDYTQAIMDLGATVCVRSKPKCNACPLSSDCIAFNENLIAQLPEPKPQRAIPTRSTVMLVLHDQAGRVLLRRRPPTGVWAELWSLPEAADLDSARRDVSALHEPRGNDIEFESLMPFTHTFSHYKLDVTPLAFAVQRTGHVSDDNGQRWATVAEAARLGLPAPVRKLLETLQKESR